jgi:hypothetical protein
VYDKLKLTAVYKNKYYGDPRLRNLIIVIVLCFVSNSYSQNVIIENESAKLKIDSKGGIIREFSLKSIAVNPIHSSYGHFICFDRWGPSSAADQAKGIPQHGEAQTVTWKIDLAPVEQENHIYSEMSCQLPKVKLSLKRKIWLDKNAAVVKIVEGITNQNSAAKIFNLVQHVSIGPPFLDATTIVDTKVIRGFSQAGTIPPTDNDTIGWPNAELEGFQNDLRYLTGAGPEHLVLSYTLDQNKEYGWVTAINAAKGLLIGYIWPLKESPWLNLWLSQWGHVPGARGLEFGTTGLHQPFDVIESIDSIFNQQLCEYIEPTETVSKSYIGFLSAIPNNYKGVQEITYMDNKITIVEYNADPARDIIINTSAVPTDVKDETSFEMPDKFQLMQNYPNPFNPNTKISYTLPSASNVSIKVYNPLGEEITSLVNSFKTAGKYTVEFNAGDLPSGIYVYRMIAGNYSCANKMLLLR